MRQLILASLAVVLLLAGRVTALVAADEDAKAVVARAIAALGGEERVARRAVSLSKVKGAGHEPVPNINFTGEIWSQGGAGYKFTLHLNFLLAGNPTVSQAIHNGKGWKDVNGSIQDLTEGELAVSRRSSYLDRMPGLLHLLHKKGFTLTLQEDVEINGKPARSVLVRSEGQPDVTLHFDKTSGLLVKQTHREKENGNETLEETYYSDYREPDLVGEEEKTVKAANVGTDGAALVAFLKTQRPGVVDGERIAKLIQQLGDDDFEVREKASKELVKLGAVAVVALKQAAKSSDAEVARRAEDCLQRIGTSSSGDRTADLTLSAIRLVALRKPDGATEALLGLLTPGGDAQLRQEVYSALAEVAVQDGKPDESLRKALEGNDALRKAAAEAVLGEDGGAWRKQPGRRLFFTGVKVPMKAELHKDGKKIFEREILSIQYFNRFEDSIFAKPGTP